MAFYNLQESKLNYIGVALLCNFSKNKNPIVLVPNLIENEVYKYEKKFHQKPIANPMQAHI